ncbi:MAG: hydroxymethylbilane synthase [Acidobacteria bacterium]|nr:hydroxymethylbilane synthase [Acidobacteriota bacterium]
MPDKPLVIGSRGSPLALRQADLVKSRLSEAQPRLPITVRRILTTGDRRAGPPLHEIGGKGVFTKEIEEALLRGEIDLAVHSLKDLPTRLPDGLCLGAITTREDARDAFLSNRFGSLAALPRRSTVGTSSLRRQCQLLHLRPDLQVKNLRGNLDTRLRKLDAGDYDAIILACAGLIRLGLDHRIREKLSVDTICPAIGQGALAVEVRCDDRLTLDRIQGLDDGDSRRAAEAERSLLGRLGGGCQVPIAGFAVVREAQLQLTGLVGAADGSRLIRESGQATPEEPVQLGRAVARRLLDRGAGDLLQMTG